jgi:uncharacterized membrane protein YdcZ (DUF606 family)
MHLQVAWCLHAIDGENPSETCIDELLSKQSSLFDQLYYYLVVLPTYQKEGRSTTVLSCRVSLVISERKKYQEHVGVSPWLHWIGLIDLLVCFVFRSASLLQRCGACLRSQNILQQD